MYAGVTASYISDLNIPEVVTEIFPSEDDQPVLAVLPRSAGPGHQHGPQGGEPLTGPQVQSGVLGPSPGTGQVSAIKAAAVGGSSEPGGLGGVITAPVLQPRLPLQAVVDVVQLLPLAGVLPLELGHHLLGLRQLLEELRRNVGTGRLS